MNLIGALAIGSIIGFIAGARNLLGIQSQDESNTQPAPSAEETSESSSDSSGETSEPSSDSSDVRYDWETGTKEGWEIIDIYYGGSSMVHEFNIVEDSINGQYSPQIETLNDRVGVRSPALMDQLDDAPFQRVSLSVRLEGDLSVYDNNFNDIRVIDNNGESIGRVRFRHGNNNIRWERDDDFEILRPFTKGEIYDISIEYSNDEFTVIINGEEYSGLNPYDDTNSDVQYIDMYSRTEGGASSSSYDDSIYWTWDDLIVESE